MAEAAQILEAIMIISFGISWPMNIIKSYRTKSTKGKSLLFLLFIDFGYVCGVVGKIVGDNITWVFAFYVLNLVMVSWDLVLYFINYTREKKRAVLFAEGAENVQAEGAEACAADGAETVTEEAAADRPADAADGLQTGARSDGEGEAAEKAADPADFRDKTERKEP